MVRQKRFVFLIPPGLTLKFLLACCLACLCLWKEKITFWAHFEDGNLLDQILSFMAFLTLSHLDTERRRRKKNIEIKSFFPAKGGKVEDDGGGDVMWLWCTVAVFCCGGVVMLCCGCGVMWRRCGDHIRHIKIPWGFEAWYLSLESQ